MMQCFNPSGNQIGDDGLKAFAGAPFKRSYKAGNARCDYRIR